MHLYPRLTSLSLILRLIYYLRPLLLALSESKVRARVDHVTVSGLDEEGLDGTALLEVGWREEVTEDGRLFEQGVEEALSRPI